MHAKTETKLLATTFEKKIEAQYEAFCSADMKTYV